MFCWQGRCKGGKVKTILRAMEGGPPRGKSFVHQSVKLINQNRGLSRQQDSEERKVLQYLHCRWMCTNVYISVWVLYCVM